MDSDDGSGEHPSTLSEAIGIVGDAFTPENRLSSSSSSSSSSAASNQENCVQLEATYESSFDPPTLIEFASQNSADQIIGNTGEDPTSLASELAPNDPNSVETDLGSFKFEVAPNDPNSVETDSGSPKSELASDDLNSVETDFGSLKSEQAPNEAPTDADSPRSEHSSNDRKSTSSESDSGSEQHADESDSDSEESDPDSPGSTTSIALSIKSESVLQSPPVQVMERSNNTASTSRIPASVFAPSKFTTPADWSVASNESLFSIHVGNNSFSRDNAILMGMSSELLIGKSGEIIIGKSGELKFEEWLSPSELAFSDSTSPLLTMGPGVKKSSNPEYSFGVEEAAAETIKEVFRARNEDKNKAKVVPVLETPHSTSLHSDGSRDSTQSFAFPIKRKARKKKKKKKRCPWLSCNCCGGCCQCGWPSCTRFKCSCGWPSCSRIRCDSICCECCSRPSCSCCNGCFSHCGWPSCHCFRSCSCKLPSCPSCSCKWPCCRSCSFKWPSCPSCSCKWPSCPSCSCKWPSCPSCSCKWPSCLSCSCKWPSCLSCSCKWPSCSCFKSCWSCKWLSWCSFSSCFGGCCKCNQPSCSFRKGCCS